MTVFDDKGGIEDLIKPFMCPFRVDWSFRSELKVWGMSAVIVDSSRA